MVQELGTRTARVGLVLALSVLIGAGGCDKNKATDTPANKTAEEEEKPDMSPEKKTELTLEATEVELSWPQKDPPTKVRVSLPKGWSSSRSILGSYVPTEAPLTDIKMIRLWANSCPQECDVAAAFERTVERELKPYRTPAHERSPQAVVEQIADETFDDRRFVAYSITYPDQGEKPRGFYVPRNKGYTYRAHPGGSAWLLVEIQISPEDGEQVWTKLIEAAKGATYVE